MKNKYDKMVKHSKDVSKEKKQAVLDAIDTLIKAKKKFTLEDVVRMSGVSRATIHRYTDAMEIINKYRDMPRNLRYGVPQDAKDTVIAALNRKVSELQKEVNKHKAEAIEDEKWKAKYEKEHEIRMKLEKQLSQNMSANW